MFSYFGKRQEPIWSVQLPYSVCETAFFTIVNGVSIGWLKTTYISIIAARVGTV